MPVFSNSRLSTYEQCPLKYKYQYVDKIEPEEGGDTVEAFMGSRVHEALEKLYNDLKLQKRNTLENLLQYFNSRWEKNWTDDIVIVKQGYTAENYRKTGEKCISDYYNRYAPFKERVLGIETSDLISLDDEGKFKWNIRMDRLDDCGDGRYEIHDYKTAGYLPRQDYLDADRQLALYSLWVKENFRDTKSVDLVWHYLVFDKELRSTRTEAQLEELRLATLVAVKSVVDAQEFPAIETALCDWCRYRSICPRWSHLYKVEELPPRKFKAEEGVKMVDELADLSLKKKELEEQIEMVKSDLIAYAGNLGVDVVFGSDRKATISITREISFPAKHSEERDELVKLLKKNGLWGEVEDLDVFSLKKILNEKKWGKDICKQLEEYTEERICESVRLAKLKDKED